MTTLQATLPPTGVQASPVDEGVQSMQQITLEEATLRLPQLIAEHKAGEEVMITQNCQPVARLIMLSQTQPHPKRGSAKGMDIYIADDFDAPLDDFKEYMP